MAIDTTSGIQQTTLAAEIFRDEPALRTAAADVDITAAIEQSGRRITIEGAEYFILEGDLLYDRDEVMLYGLQQQARIDAARVGVPVASTTGSPAALAVNTAAGKIVRWKPGMVLTYAVIRASFADQAAYQEVVDCMHAATDAWMATCGVSFEHLDQFDAHPDPSAVADQIDPALVFTVRFIDAGGQFIAAAFFPTYPPARRRVLIDPSFFGEDLTFDKIGVLRHELGHTLGFRHEHIRAEAPPTCPDEDLADVFGITPYDPTSVMHYFCGGSGSNALEITPTDRDGAQRIYGLPLAESHFVE